MRIVARGLPALPRPAGASVPFVTAEIFEQLRRTLHAPSRRQHSTTLSEVYVELVRERLARAR